MPAKKVGFYCELPVRTVAEISRRAKTHGVPKWMVVEDAVTLETTAIMHPRSISGGPRRKARGAK